MRKVLSKDGTPIAFDQAGHGPGLILIGGALTIRTDQASLAAALAPNFTVITYDRRGRGESGDSMPYAVAREVEDLEALLDESGGSAFVFGHSSGAVLSLEAAHLLPEKITKLALYEPPFIIDNSRMAVPEDSLSHITELISSGRKSEAVEYFLEGVGTPAEIRALMRLSPMWPRAEAIVHTLIYDLTIIENTQKGDPFPLKKWSSVAVSTLVMDGTMFFGSEDGHTFLRHAAIELADILPNAQHRILEGQD
ncbi:MAG TPA: alpha/beta hydrolase, partial [Ktedonobacteraceae bacterium]|nr:alpha/beta hydrolase [Ktedonobacteraceae bacterium]